MSILISDLISDTMAVIQRSLPTMKTVCVYRSLLHNRAKQWIFLFTNVFRYGERLRMVTHMA